MDTEGMIKIGEITSSTNIKNYPTRIKRDGESVIITTKNSNPKLGYEETRYVIPFNDIKELVLSVFNS